jgi:putative ABC transport system permease protein
MLCDILSRQGSAPGPTPSIGLTPARGKPPTDVNVYRRMINLKLAWRTPSPGTIRDVSVGSIYYHVRTSLDPEQFVATVPRIVAKLDANLPVTVLRTMPQQLRENVFLDRFIGVLAATFAGLATLLAAVGLYGVLAYGVAQRTREIGLRMALGAAPSRVRAMILRQLAAMAAIGGTIGLVGAVGIGRLAESMLYQLKGTDPTVLVGAALALAGVALAASYLRTVRLRSIRSRRCGTPFSSISSQSRPRNLFP